MPQLPSKVKVGFRTYIIKKWHPVAAASSRRYGECSSLERVIRIDNSFGSIQTVETLLHELIHAVCDIWCRAPTADEEDTAGPLSSGLTAVLVDNPKILKFIQDSLAEGT
jgi:hypothetical protein